MEYKSTSKHYWIYALLDQWIYLRHNFSPSSFLLWKTRNRYTFILYLFEQYLFQVSIMICTTYIPILIIKYITLIHISYYLYSCSWKNLHFNGPKINLTFYFPWQYNTLKMMEASGVSCYKMFMLKIQSSAVQPHNLLKEK